MQRNMLYKATHFFAGREYGGGEVKLTVDSVTEFCREWKLVEILVIDYLTPGEVEDRSPCILGVFVSLSQYGIKVFAVIGGIAVLGSIDSETILSMTKSSDPSS